MPSPLAARTTSAVFGCTAVTVLVVVALWVFPGFLAGGPRCPSWVDQGNRSYCAETVNVVGQNCTTGNLYGPACPRPVEFTFAGVWFQVFGSLANSSIGPDIYGFVNESGGPGYQSGLPGQFAFNLRADPLGPRSLNWTSLDDNVLIAWHAPFTMVGPDGELSANVTCGVYLAGGIGS